MHHQAFLCENKNNSSFYELEEGKTIDLESQIISTHEEASTHSHNTIISMHCVQAADLVSAVSKPAAGSEVQAALSACGDVRQLEFPVAVHPGASDDDVVGFAVGRHQGVHLAILPQLDPRPPCRCRQPCCGHCCTPTWREAPRLLQYW